MGTDTSNRNKEITYPNAESEWKRYPLGSLMLEAFQKENNKEKKFDVHNNDVFQAANKLCDENMGKDLFDDQGWKAFKPCLNALAGDFSDTQEIPKYLDRRHLMDVSSQQFFIQRKSYQDNEFFQEYKQELLYATLFHDIGKLIIHERHPVVGLHVVADLYPEKRTELIKQLSMPRYRTLLMLIRDHDKFGVLSTGEASLPILASVGRYFEAEKLDARKSLSMLFLLTLADIAGSAAARPKDKKEINFLSNEKVDLICKDWATFDQIIVKSEGQRERILKETVLIAQTPSATIERIFRLVVDSSKDCPELQNKLNAMNLIEDALEDAFGPHMDVFCTEFALIAKFDYCLYFLRDLMKYCDEKGKEPHEVIEIVIAILRRITHSYRGLTSATRIDPIGVGFEHLRLKEEESKRKMIIELLFRSRERALRWLVDEIAGWQVV